MICLIGKPAFLPYRAAPMDEWRSGLPAVHNQNLITVGFAKLVWYILIYHFPLRTMRVFPLRSLREISRKERKVFRKERKVRNSNQDYDKGLSNNYLNL